MNTKFKLNPVAHYSGILFIITFIFAIVLSGTNLLTQDVIAQRIIADRTATRERLIAGVLAPYEKSEGEQVEESTNIEAENAERTNPADTPPSAEAPPNSIAFDAVIENWEYDPTVWVYLKDGEIVAYIAIASGRGYGGEIEIMVAMDSEFMIAGIEILNETENRWLSASLHSESFISQFENKRVPLEVITRNRETQGEHEIMAIYGARSTTEVITETVNNAVAIAWIFSENIAGSMIEEAYYDEAAV